MPTPDLTARILDYVAQHPGASQRKVAQALGCSYYAVREATRAGLPPPGQPTSEPTSEPYRYEESSNGNAAVSGIVPHCSLERFLVDSRVDLSVWTVERYVINSWEMGRRDRRVELDYQDGAATGSVRDTGLIAKEQLYQIKVWLTRRVEERGLEQLREAVIAAMREHSPRYDKPRYRTAPPESRYMLEIAIPDLHVGKLAWGQEAGEDYDIKIAEQAFRGAVEHFLEKTRGYDIGRVLFVVGNDLLHVDNENNATALGTRQDVGSRWQKSFKRALELLVWGIDRMVAIAPVHIPVIPGNHATSAEHLMGEVLSAWYRLNPAVTVDNRPKHRKYVRYGNSLIGYTHGHHEKHADLPLIMATEAPEQWAATRYRAWHIGHLHHKRTTRHEVVRERNGVEIRISPALCAVDAWHSQKGYVGSVRGAEAFLWHPSLGLEAHLSYSLFKEAPCSP